ncbi:MAG: hypothetical protein PUD20_03545 [bacterium]|nr:hypothetical protein [bacterium]
MNISALGTYSGYYNYNSIRIDRQAQAALQAQKNQEELAAQQQQQKTVDSRPIEQNFGAEDYAKQYDSRVTYEMKGADSDIKSLDAGKNVADGQKSLIMQQYQLFMGETQAQGSAQAAMNTQAVRGVENFTF